MFVMECKENPTMPHLKIEPNFLFDLNRGVVKNKHEQWQKWHKMLEWEVCDKIPLQFSRYYIIYKGQFMSKIKHWNV